MAHPRPCGAEPALGSDRAAVRRPAAPQHRGTWQDFITAWGRSTDGNPVTTHLNAATEYVVSRTLENADAWQNSILLRGDAVDTVAELKARPGRDLSIIGSASLVRSLHAAALIDRYTLLRTRGKWHATDGGQWARSGVDRTAASSRRASSPNSASTRMSYRSATTARADMYARLCTK
jgi:dihydrofolate reductase